MVAKFSEDRVIITGLRVVADRAGEFAAAALADAYRGLDGDAYLIAVGDLEKRIRTRATDLADRLANGEL